MRGECEVDGKIEKLQGNPRDREMGNKGICRMKCRWDGRHETALRSLVK